MRKVELGERMLEKEMKPSRATAALAKKRQSASGCSCNMKQMEREEREAAAALAKEKADYRLSTRRGERLLGCGRDQAYTSPGSEEYGG
jgi:hypothetical protein